MRYLFALLAFFVVLPAQAALRVVTTVPDLAAIVQEVGKDKVKVSALVLSSQDPHFVDARPNLVLDVSSADLLLVVGLELEVGWLPTLVSGARNPKVQTGGPGYLDCSQFVGLMDVPTEKVDRSMGDVHPGGNPHYLYDPRNAIAVAWGIAGKMGALDPSNAAAYQNNATDLIHRLQSSITGWEQKLSAIRGTQVITYHKSWTYLANWLGFAVPINVEPKPGIPPSPSHIVQVIGTVGTAGVKLILQEEFYQANTAELVASKSGAKLVRLAGGTAFEKGETYIQHFDTAVAKIAAALGG
jgi:zinc/manganese transport system substrate-binding protein